MASNTDMNLNLHGNFIDNISPGLSGLLNGGIAGLTTALAGLAAAFSIASISTFVQDAINAGDELDKLAMKTGTTVEALSGLQLAAELSDVSTEGMAMSLKKLSKAMVDAQDATSTQAFAFKSLGIETTDSTGNIRQATDVMADIADVFQNSADDAFKVSAAMDLMGKAGADMIPLLNGGSEELKKINKEAEVFGLVWSKDQTAQAAEFNDSITRIGSAFDGMWQTIAKNLLPALSEMASYLASSAQEGGVLRAVLDSLGSVITALFVPFKALADVVAVITAAFNIAGHAIGGFMAATAAALSMDFSSAKQIMIDTGNDIKKIATDYETFSENLWSAKSGKPADQTAIEETKKSVGDLGAAEKKRFDEAEKDAKKLADEYTKANAEMQKQLFTVGSAGKVVEVAWQNAFGQYAKFSEAQKANLLNLAKEIDLQTVLIGFQKQKMALVWQLSDASYKIEQTMAQSMNGQSIATREANQAISDYKYSLTLWARAQLEALDISDKQLQKDRERVQASNDADKALKLETIAIAEKNNADQRAAVNQKTAESLRTKAIKDLYENAVATSKNKMEMEAWNNIIQTNRDAHEKLNFELEKMNVWLKEGIITQEEYDLALEKHNKKVQELWKSQSEANQQYYDLILADKEAADKLKKSQEILTKAYNDGTISLSEYNYKMKQVSDQMRNMDSTYAIDQVDKLDGTIKRATASFEGMFSDYIFEGMQGNWQNLGDMVKKIIDRMVADMIAAQIQAALFGDIGDTPSGKTPKSTGALGGIFSGIFGGSTSTGGTSAPSGGQGSGAGFWGGVADLFGGFFANGGDVNADQFYMVGEKGPELFRPNTAGAIVPNNQLGGSQVAINITAMDSQDVMRVLGSKRRELAEMLTATNRTYNLQGA